MDPNSASAAYIFQVISFLDTHQPQFRFGHTFVYTFRECNRLCTLLFQAWGIMEEELRNFESARKLFKAGVEADKTNMKLWDCWAESEEALGYYQRANEIRNLAGQNIAPTPGRTFTTLTRNEPAFEPIIEQVSSFIDRDSC